MATVIELKPKKARKAPSIYKAAAKVLFDSENAVEEFEHFKAKCLKNKSSDDQLSFSIFLLGSAIFQLKELSRGGLNLAPMPLDDLKVIFDTIYESMFEDQSLDWGSHKDEQ